MTNEAAQYKKLSASAERGFARHSASEYVSLAAPLVHSNTIEGAFSIFKRGMKCCPTFPASEDRAAAGRA